MGERWTDRGRQLAELGELASQVTADGPVDELLFRTLLSLSQVLDPEVDTGACVDRLHRISERISADGSPRGVVRSLMESGFGGAGARYLSWRNSSVAHALLSGNGLPLTLGVITIVAAASAGCRLDLIGLPFHVVVGCPIADGDSHPLAQPRRHDAFIDALVPSVCDLSALEGIVARNSRGRLQFDAAMLAVMSNRDVLVRVLNNLENAANAGRDLPLLGLVRVARAMFDSRLATVQGFDAAGRSGPASRHMLN